MRLKAKGFWVAFYPIDPSDGNEVEFLFCSTNKKSAVRIFPGKTCYPYLETYPTTDIKVFDGEFNGQASVSLSNLELSANNDTVTEFHNYIWDGARVKIYKGPADAVLDSQLVNTFTGVMDGSPEIREGKCTVKVVDKGYLIDKDMTLDTYQGNGGIEGPPELKGTYKPITIGMPIGIEPTLINSPYLIFQYHSGYQECDPLIGLYENGLAFDAAHTTVNWAGSAAATFIALQAVTLALGEWADCPSLGCFRLGGEPKNGGVLTCDPYNPTVSTLADMVEWLIQFQGGVPEINATSLAALQTNCHNQTVGDYIKETSNIKGYLETYLSQVGGYMFWDQDGEANFGLVRIGTPTLTLRTDGTTSPVALESTAMPVSAPFKRLRMGADRCFRVHQTNEISDALIEAFELSVGLDAGLTKSFVVLPVNGSNVVTSYALAAGTFYVKGSASGTDYSTNFTLSTVAGSNPQGLTMNYTGQSYSVTGGFDAGEDAAVVTIRAIGSGPMAGKTFDRTLTLSKSIANTNQSNDRNNVAIVTPTVATDGSAISIGYNEDGSGNIRFSWGWLGVNADIDGWVVTVAIRDTNAVYSFGTAKSYEQEFTINDPSRRDVMLPSLPVNKWYTIFVRAYRVVDYDIDVTGTMWSSAVKSTATGQNPYRPNAVVYIGGISTAVIAAAVTNFNINNDRNNNVPGAATSITLSGALWETGDALVQAAWNYTVDSDPMGVNNIDGFIVGFYRKTSGATWTYNTSFDNDILWLEFDSSKRRAHIMKAVATQYHWAVVYAYRRVDTDISATGLILSLVGQSSAASGLRPATTSNWMGTISGVNATTVVGVVNATTGKVADNAVVKASFDVGSINLADYSKNSATVAYGVSDSYTEVSAFDVEVLNGEAVITIIAPTYLAVTNPVNNTLYSFDFQLVAVPSAGGTTIYSDTYRYTERWDAPSATGYFNLALNSIVVEHKFTGLSNVDYDFGFRGVTPATNAAVQPGAIGPSGSLSPPAYRYLKTNIPNGMK